MASFPRWFTRRRAAWVADQLVACATLLSVCVLLLCAVAWIESW